MCIMHSPTRRLRAFTLIELLVVVAIIALLLAILMPALTRARAQARSAVCVSNLHQFGVVMYQYVIEHKDFLPRACNDGDRTNWTVEVARKVGLIKRLPSGFTVNDLQVHKMEIFHCPERLRTAPAPFLDYLVNAMDPEGPRRDGAGTAPDARGGWWDQVRHFDEATSALSKITAYKRPSEVVYLADVEREDKNDNTGFAQNHACMREARENYYRYRETGEYQKPGNVAGAIGVMDAWRGGHMPQGKGDWNTDDRPGPRRVARKMHLNRFTNASFMDGHAAGISVVDRDDVANYANYAYWLRLFGVRDAQRIAEQDPDLE